MPVRVSCPQCQSVWQVHENALGKTVQCSHCQTRFAAEAMQTVDMKAEVAMQTSPRTPAVTAPIALEAADQPKKKSGSYVPVVIALVAGGFVLFGLMCTGMAGAMWYFLSYSKPVAQKKAQLNPPPMRNWPPPVDNDPPPVRPPPPAFELPPEIIDPPIIERPVQPKPPPGLAPIPAAKLTPISHYVPKGAKEEVAVGAISDAAVGGGGRYLILHRAAEQKLAVFDVQLGKVAKELPLAESVIHFAAGANQLAVVYPNPKLLQVWNLTTFEKERTVPLPTSVSRDDIHQICMGSASNGPLFIYLPREKRTYAMDLEAKATAEIRWNHWSHTNAYGPLHMRASPDGNMLLGWAGGWAGLDVATFREGRQLGANDKYEFSLGIFALPSADGRLVFTPWAIVDRDMRTAKVPELKDVYMVPAQEPGYFFALTAAGRGLPHTPYQKGASPKLPGVRELVLYTDERRKLFSISDCTELNGVSDMYWERRIFYYPGASLLVTLGTDRVVMRRIDLVAQLDKSGQDYLLVLSQPPSVKAGSAFAYRLDIRSKKGGVKVKRESGPDGLTVSTDGRISWNVPADASGTEPEVLLSIGDASGQEVFHRFKVQVVPR